MVYKVIGIMSGSSLDGLDIAHVQLEEVRGQWQFNILHADCVLYNDSLANALRQAGDQNVGDFLKLHTSFGRYIGDEVNTFILRNDLEHQVHFIASHGHTAFHEPQNRTTWQLGDGAAIAATTGLPVISDLRSMDVALGGQGAPIVPIGDKLLFGEYDYLLNLGGIANITILGANQPPLAFDICPANQILNLLAEREGLTMDKGGSMAQQGMLLGNIMSKLDSHDYYKSAAPKSLSNAAAIDIAFPLLEKGEYSTNDLLHTATIHIARRIETSVKQYSHSKDQATMLVTGGGAFNSFLITELQKMLDPLKIELKVPDDNVVMYKEALVMALIGVLRWREEVNVLSSVTGASRDSAGGALWLP